MAKNRNNTLPKVRDLYRQVEKVGFWFTIFPVPSRKLEEKGPFVDYMGILVNISACTKVELLMQQQDCFITDSCLKTACGSSKKILRSAFVLS